MKQLRPNWRNRWAAAYIMHYKGRRTMHAVRTRWASLGNLRMDSMLGGGMHVLCGRPAAGEATISPHPRPVFRVTCKQCIHALEEEDE